MQRTKIKSPIVISIMSMLERGAACVVFLNKAGSEANPCTIPLFIRHKT